MEQSLSESETGALVPPDLLPISEWIEANRVLHGSYAAEPGPKKIARTPFVRPILDAWLDPWVREIVVQKSAQIGLTDLAIDLVGHTAANDPSPMAVFLADQLTAEKVMVDRVQPMLRSTACLRPFVEENRLTKQEAYLRNGYNLTCSWASSIAQTASRPFKHLILDEINKPGYSATGEEGSALGRLRQRQETFADSKLLMMSTPTGEAGNISRELASCDAVYDWCVPCPKCGAYQPLRWTAQEVGGRKTGGVVWEGGLTATLQQIEATARYQCGECSETWTTTEKNAAVLLGQAMPRADVPPRARRVGFQLNRIMSLFPGGRLEKLVLDFIESKKDILDFQNFVNSALGEHFKQTVKEISAKSLEARKWKLPPLVCPEGTMAITAGIDVQKVGMFHSCWAWRYDLAKDRLLGSMVYHGFLPTWSDLTNLIFKTQFRVQGTGETIGIWRAGIDTGGATDEKDEDGLNRTEETYYWLKQNSQDVVFGTKGMSKNTKPGQLIRHSVLEVKAGEMSIGSIVLWLLDTTRLKERVVWRLESTDEDPEPVNFHSETDEDFFKQLRGEQKIRDSNGHVKWVKKGANHYFDATIIAHACADFQWAGGVPILAAVMQQTGGQKHEDRGREEDRDGGWTSGGRSSRGNSRGWLSRR